MKKANWKDIAELVGIAAIVASLVFVGLQMQQEREIAEAQIYSQREDTAIELSRLINENGDVWIRGLQGSELSELEELQFLSLARHFISIVCIGTKGPKDLAQVVRRGLRALRHSICINIPDCGGPSISNRSDF